MHKQTMLMLNALTAALLGALGAQILHEACHGATAVLVGAEWQAFNLMGFGYLFVDPLFYQSGHEQVGDWQKVVASLGGSWAVRLPILLVGAGGLLWGFFWLACAALRFAADASDKTEARKSRQRGQAMHVPTKTCPHCGAGIRENDAHCPDCGAALRVSQANPTPPAGSLAAVSPPIPPHANLPPELADLHAPKPSQPLEASGCMLFFFLAWTLFSALFLVVGVGTYLRDSSAYHRLSREGLPAVAVITELDFASDEDSIRYYVAYHFQASIRGDPTRFHGSDNISSALFSRLEVGQPLEILYWPTDPSLSAVKAELQPPSLTLLLGFGGMGGLFTLLGLVMMVSSIMGIVNTSRLRMGGQVAQGIVFKKWIDTDADGDTTYFVAYAFNAEMPGKGFQRILRAEQNKRLYDNVPVGGGLMVRYLPDDPHLCRAHIER